MSTIFLFKKNKPVSVNDQSPVIISLAFEGVVRRVTLPANKKGANAFVY